MTPIKNRQMEVRDRIIQTIHPMSRQVVAGQRSQQDLRMETVQVVVAKMKKVRTETLPHLNKMLKKLLNGKRLPILLDQVFLDMTIWIS